MTIRAAVLVVSAALVAAGCGGVGGLDELKSSDKPYFYVGTSFDGLDLTHVDAPSPHVASFIYGNCEAASDMGCSPPLEIQNRICAHGRPIIVLYGDDGRTAKAAKALQPLNDVARKAGEPFVAFDNAPPC